MKEESREITLGLGRVSLERELGPYYIDMRPARVHYEDDIYGGGFDEEGVPMVRSREGRHYLPVNVAQYGFILHADWAESGDSEALGGVERCVAALDRLKSPHGSPRGEAWVWWHRHRQPKYGIDPPWACAMAQGEAISLYLRLYQETGDPALLETARGAWRFLSVPFEEGGARRLDDAGHLWFEEYPSREPSFVLNGFVYTLFGLYDLFRVTGDAEVEAEIQECLATLRANLHRFDAGYWSLYDLQKRELVRYYYQKNVHVPQMAVLHGLTGDPFFEEWRARWEAQITPLNFLFVRLMYRVRPRLQKLRSVLRG